MLFIACILPCVLALRSRFRFINIESPEHARSLVLQFLILMFLSKSPLAPHNLLWWSFCPFCLYLQRDGAIFVSYCRCKQFTPHRLCNTLWLSWCYSFRKHPVNLNFLLACPLYHLCTWLNESPCIFYLSSKSVSNLYLRYFVYVYYVLFGNYLSCSRLDCWRLKTLLDRTLFWNRRST